MSAYGTVVYVTPTTDFLVDFTAIPYKKQPNRQESCACVLVVSTWMDNRWGLSGGGVEAGEHPLDTMNREFREEIGAEAG